MDSFELKMCGVTFRAMSRWVFAPADRFIFARPESQLGILQIYPEIDTAGLETSAGKNLYRLSASFLLKEKPGKPFDMKPVVGDVRQFGAASYRVKRQNGVFIIRIWFLKSGDDLLFAAYGCPWKYRNDSVALTEMNESEQMLLTTRFQ